jgi:hypothetical protein
MSVDERLRAGLAANAETMEAAVERRLEEVRDRRRGEVRRLWAGGALVAAATVAVVVALTGRPATRSAEPVDTPSPSESATAYAGPRIPDGSWSKVATAAEARRRGLDAPVVQRLLGADGKLPVTLRIAGDRFAILVTEEDGGVPVPGDSGSLSYDGRGRLVTVSESPGCPGCIGVYTWTVDGDALTMAFARGSTSTKDDERLVTEGTFHRKR